jgi:hypothetical protein
MSYAVRKDGQGWRAVQDASECTSDEVWQEEQPAVAVTNVIASASPRQIRMALTRAGLRAQVEAAVAAGDQDLKDWWEFATTFERDNAQVTAMGLALGQTEAQLDALWQLAATL